MIEIKLKAWDKLTHKLFDVVSIDWQQGILHGIYDNHSDWEVTREKADRILAIAQVELLQYIGFHDKNDKEIYGGHILQTPNGYKVLIVFDESSAAFKARLAGIFINLPLDKDSARDLEIIGTIYETPDLFASN